MIRSPPNTSQRSQLHSRQSNDFYLKLSSQKCSSAKPLNVACTPKHLLYRVPKSIIKTGGSTRNVDSVIKPREFNKYLEAFRCPNTSTASPSALLTSLQSKGARCPGANPLIAPGSLIPATPTVPESMVCNSHIPDSSLVEPSPRCNVGVSRYRPPVDRRTSLLKTTQTPPSAMNCENVCNEAEVVDENPFQPRQKALRRTPPKTGGAPPPPTLSTQAAAPLSTPLDPIPNTSLPAATQETLRSECGVQHSQEEEEEEEEAAAMEHQEPLQPTCKRVTSGRVMHSPPALLQAELTPHPCTTTTITTTTALASASASASAMTSSSRPTIPAPCRSSAVMASSAAGVGASSAMRMLLANGYAPREITRASNGVLKDIICASGDMEVAEVSNKCASIIGQQQQSDVCHMDVFGVPTNNVKQQDAVQMYADKLRKRFQVEDSPMTKKEQKEEQKEQEEKEQKEEKEQEEKEQEVCERPVIASPPVIVLPIEVERAEVVAGPALASAVVGPKEMCSKSLMTSFDFSRNDSAVPATDNRVALLSDHHEELEVIKREHMHQEKQLQMELLLQRCRGNAASLAMLDARREARDQKSLRIETEIQLREANQLLLFQQRKFNTQTTVATSPISSINLNNVSRCLGEQVPAPPPDARYPASTALQGRQPREAAGRLQSPITQHLSLEFSVIAAGEEEGEGGGQEMSDLTMTMMPQLDVSGEYDMGEGAVPEGEDEEEERRVSVNMSVAGEEEHDEVHVHVHHQDSSVTEMDVVIEEGDIEGADEVELGSRDRSGSSEGSSCSGDVGNSVRDRTLYHGMIFVPLRGAKQCHTVGHVTKSHKSSSALTPSCAMGQQSPATRQVPSKKKGKRAAFSSRSQQSADQSVDEDQPSDKRLCQKKTPVKAKRSAVNKLHEEVAAKKSVPAATKSVPQETDTNTALPTDKQARSSTSADVTPTKSKAIKCKKQSAAAAAGDCAAVPQKKIRPQKKTAKPVKKAALKKETAGKQQIGSLIVQQTSATTSSGSGSGSSDLAGSVSTMSSADKESFERFCAFTRASVEVILAQAPQKGKRPAAPSKSVAAEEVERMLVQMWDVQTDSEREEWRSGTSEQQDQQEDQQQVPVPAAAHMVISAKQTKHPKQMQKQTKKKPPAPPSASLSPPSSAPAPALALLAPESLPESDTVATPVKVKAKVGVPRVVLQEVSINTPVQLPTKAASKRQKRKQLVEGGENEEAQDVQEFVPKRKITKKALVSQVEMSKKPSLYPHQGIQYPKILPLKTKMSALIPKLKLKI